MQRSARRLLMQPGWLAAMLFLLGACSTAFIANAQQNPSPQAPSASNPAAKPAQAGPKPQAATNASAPKAFSTPQEAAKALYSAARNHDEDAVVVILGPGSKDVVVWTDDPKLRGADMDEFVHKYEQMHRLVREPDQETTLYVGAENWPLPIPIVERNGKWYFDSGLGRQEILFRRIGENEMSAIESLRSLVDAENEYYEQTGGTRQYAERFTATSGTHDGLYWPDAKGSEDCPIGPYLAQANYDGADRKPLHGYYFRVLKEQGPKAVGGARNFVVDGKMTGGFAFLAFPAEYRSSGVQTFIVGSAGNVYEKDLGPMTEQLAKSLKVYNPDATWSKVRESKPGLR